VTHPTRHLVTGAGSGIGAALVAALHGRGDALLLRARSSDRADELAATYPGAADPPGLQGALAEAELPDALDSVIHVAGAVDLAPVAELDLADWQRQLDVNLTAPALLTKAALPALRAARGLVLFVNSGAGLSAHPDWSGYAASKFGLRALADALRGEEQPNGVRVTTVFPGRTATPMQEKVHRQEGREYDASAWIDPGTVAATILHVLDLPRDATIPEVSVHPAPR
jgi:short-subunit dehydrogenase